MNHAFSAMLKLHDDIIAAQKAQLEAMQQGLNAADDVAKIQEAGQKMVEAQASMWASWLSFWGLR